MLPHQEFQGLPTLHQLELTAPSSLEQALSYTGTSRWLGLYWEPALSQVCHTDGQSIGVGSSQAWQVFCTHPQVSALLAPYHFGNDGQPAQHYLLLDRNTRHLYVGESADVEECLKHPEVLALLAQMGSVELTGIAETSQSNVGHWLGRGISSARTLILSSPLLLLLLLPAQGKRKNKVSQKVLGICRRHQDIQHVIRTHCRLLRLLLETALSGVFLIK